MATCLCGEIEARKSEVALSICNGSAAYCVSAQAPFRRVLKSLDKLFQVSVPCQCSWRDCRDPLVKCWRYLMAMLAIVFSVQERASALALLRNIYLRDSFTSQARGALTRPARI
jgi:hypothetical protein